MLTFKKASKFKEAIFALSTAKKQAYLTLCQTAAYNQFPNMPKLT